MASILKIILYYTNTFAGSPKPITPRVVSILYLSVALPCGPPSTVFCVAEPIRIRRHKLGGFLLLAFKWAKTFARPHSPINVPLIVDHIQVDPFKWVHYNHFEKY